MPPAPGFCACCTPGVPLAPARISNRPGLSEIAWRPGSYATFRQTMIEQIARGARDPVDADDPRWPAEVRMALAALSTRDDADYAIMLIDLFAAVGDVLAFYSERQANEMFLRTARDRDALLRLLRLIGYHPSPGTAATTVLAFTLDRGATVAVSPGLKVMSVPGQDERPQTFETIAAITAHAVLNDLPVYGAPLPIAPFAANLTRVPIRARPELVRGNRVVIVGAELELNAVRAIEMRADGEYLELARAIAVPGASSVGFKLRRELDLFGHNVPASYPHYDANPAVAPALRWTTRVAGSDYPIQLAAGLARYALSRKVDGLTSGTLLLVDCGPTAPQRFAFAIVSAIEQDAATLGPLTDTVTHVRLQPAAVPPGGDAATPLAGQGLPAIPDLRRTRVFELESQPIVPRLFGYPPTLAGQTLYVRSDDLDDAGALEQMRWIIISAGAQRHLARVTGTAMLAAAGGTAHIAVGFTPGLAMPLAEARMSANIVAASHGETQPDETLGHGDGTRAFQSFRLQRGPLTRIAGGRGGAPAPELAVRVNGELWRQVASFYGQGPRDRVYTATAGGDGATTLRFGDGRTGSRLPSGASNVVARYRTGLGSAGRVRADQLTTLLTRPVGLRAVTNPFPADGGDDPETLARAQVTAPATVRTFGRAIALIDFEHVARQTGLVAQARATWAWIGVERAIQLSVGGPNGARLSTVALAQLVAALRGVRDPNHPLIVGNVWRVPLVIAARLLRDRAFATEAVEAAARDCLAALFAPDRQPLGRAVHLSQVIAALHNARGVAAVAIERLHLKGAAGWMPAQLARRGATADPVQPHVRIFDARPRPPVGQLDPLSIAGLAHDPDALALPAEQAFIESLAADVSLRVVEAL